MLRRFLASLSGRQWGLDYFRLAALLLAAAMHFQARAADTAGPWRLSNQQGASAQLAEGSTAEALRITMGDKPGTEPWHVQLALPGVQVKKGARLRIEFRARAAAPRGLNCSVGMNHDPWKSLGLYREFKISNEWEVFIIDFSPSADDAEGRLYFDLGGNSADMEIERASVSLMGPDGAPAVRFPSGGGASQPSVNRATAGAAAPADLQPAPVAAVPTPVADWKVPQPTWSLFTFEGCAAELQPLNGLAGVRVEKIKSASNTPWQVRLSQTPTAWRNSERYTLKFKARADKPRQLAVNVQQSHEPYKISFYSLLDAAPEWRQFQWEFSVESNEESATLHFDLGGDATAIEIADFTLTTVVKAAATPNTLDAPAAAQDPAVKLEPVPNSANQSAPVQPSSGQSAPVEPALNTSAPVQPVTALVPAAQPAALVPVDQPQAGELPTSGQLGPAPGDSSSTSTGHESPLRAGWVFSVAAGNVAELAPVHNVPGGYRVVILHLEAADDWRVQLRHGLGAVQAGQVVVLSFRVRADGPRPMSLGLVSGDPWPKVLGLAEEIGVSPAWQTVERRFTVTESHAAAALELNFGHSEVSATISEVRLSIAGELRVGG